MADEERRTTEREARRGDKEARAALVVQARRDLGDPWGCEPTLRWVVDDKGLAKARQDGVGAILSLEAGDVVLVELLHAAPVEGRFLGLVVWSGTEKRSRPRPHVQRDSFGNPIRSTERRRNKNDGAPSEARTATVVVLDLLLAKVVQEEKPKKADSNDWVTRDRWFEGRLDNSYGKDWRMVRVFPDDTVCVVRRAAKPVAE